LNPSFPQHVREEKKIDPAINTDKPEPEIIMEGDTEEINTAIQL